MQLEILRHSTEHLLSMAVLALFPGTKLVMGPSTRQGFYGDFDFPEGVTLNEEDLPRLEAKMGEFVEQALPFIREELSLEKAREKFKDNPYKLFWLEEIAKREEKISIYYVGDTFYDLCAGPHVENTSSLRVFKLLSIAGAYWHGDAKNKMVTRIYGTAFVTHRELNEYLTRIEEARKRDHRKLGKEMDLFHFEPDFAPGAVFWHDKGYRIFRCLLEYMRQYQSRNGYLEVSTPTLMDRSLWEKSGHWQQYGEHNYSGSTEDNHTFCVKPMNCPGSILIYKQGKKSYRDLPLKMAEFGRVNRYEPSGALMGLMRVREFTQDDAHIFCTPAQMEMEVAVTVELVLEIYRNFGFEEVRIYLSTRPEKRIGSDETWDLCESALKSALNMYHHSFELKLGEGAFYGPKLEFILKDAIGREWQCGTIQVDMNLPERFDLKYVEEDGLEYRPVMLHRALFGSIERFLGILIEHYAGKLPLWLIPTVAVVTSLTKTTENYAKEVFHSLEKAHLPVILDLSSETIGYKIRKHTAQKIPIIIILGTKEETVGKISFRRHNQTRMIPLVDFIREIQAEIALKS